MKETKFIYFPLYLSDYVSEARKMTMIQRGAFTDLACLYFQENLKLPYTKQLIYRMVFAFEKEEQDAVDFILDNYFIQSEQEPMGLIWVSNSLDLIGCKVLKRLDANRENGKLGGRGNKKDNKPMGSELGNPNHNPDESILNESKLNQIKPILKPKGSIKPKKTQPKPTETQSVIPDFVSLELWESYVEMRFDKKKALTERAIKLTLKDLQQFEAKQKGFANLALENAIKGSWQGVFEPKTNQTLQPQTKISPLADELNAIAGNPLFEKIHEEELNGEKVTLVKLTSLSSKDKWSVLPDEIKNNIRAKIASKFSGKMRMA